MSSQTLKIQTIKISKKVLIFSLMLLLIQFLINISSGYLPVYQILITNLFFLLLTTAVVITINYVSKIKIEKTGFTFIAFLFLKFVMIFIFLFFLKNKNIASTTFIANFSIVYLFHLFYSMFLSLKSIHFYQKNKN
jgi:hypothetical protein